MDLDKIFHLENHSATLVVVPLGNISSLAGDQVQPELERVLAEFDRLGAKSVVVDFSKVSYFGSVMLAAVQMLWRRVRAAGGKLAVSNVSQVGREVLQVSKFDTIWPIFNTRAEALQALG